MRRKPSRGSLTLIIGTGAEEVLNKSFTVGPGGGPQSLADITVDALTNYSFWVYRATFTGSGVSRLAGALTWVNDDAFESLYIYGTSQDSYTEVPLAANLVEAGSDNYVLTFSPTTGPPSLASTRSAVSAAFDGGDGCTVRGTPGDDVLKGTSGDDVICGFGGNDVIHGGGGNDTIHAGKGNDEVHGGTGHDTIVGGKGHDVIHGGDGADNIAAGNGRDTVHHTKGHDWVHGGKHKDKLIDVGF